MSLFKKQSMKSEEFETLTNKITELKAELLTVRSTIETTVTNMNSLRGLINRRLKMTVEEETPDPINEKYKDFT